MNRQPNLYTKLVIIRILQSGLQHNFAYHECRDLQFKFDFERQIFKNFNLILFTSRVLARNLLKRCHEGKFSYFRYDVRCIISHYLLDYCDFKPNLNVSLLEKANISKETAMRNTSDKDSNCRQVIINGQTTNHLHESSC